MSESSDQRFKRYESAKADLVAPRSELEDVYDYVAPGRVNFRDIRNSGETLTVDIWDHTAINGVRAWANNVQSILMPPFRKWYELKPGNAIQNADMLDESEVDDIERELQNTTELLFRNLNQSNIYQIINESFQDLAISTGVIGINETKGHVPFSFVSVPMDEIYFEEGFDGKYTSFYRDICMKARAIDDKWGDKLKLPQWLATMIKNSPDENIDLIEACIEYPQESEDKRYFYYIQDPKTKKDLYTEYRSYPAFIGFRLAKRPGDTLGYGICQALFPTIKMLNLLKLYYIKSNKFAAYPAYLAASDGVLNPYTAVIEPGSIIPIAPTGGTPPIQPLQSGARLDFAGVSIEQMQNEINEALFVNPLGDVASTKDRTAAEMNIRQQNWTRQNATGIGRLANELVRPLIKACITILRKRGLIKDIQTSMGALRIDAGEKSVWIDYKSPMIGIQDEEDAQGLLQYMQSVAGFMGPEGLVGVMNFQEIPQYLAQKLNIDLDLIKTPQQVMQATQKAAQQMATQKAQEAKAQELAQQQAQPIQQIPLNPLNLGE